MFMGHTSSPNEEAAGRLGLRPDMNWR
jgi:hypothetical protein